MKIIKRGGKPVEIPGAHRGTWECMNCGTVIELDGRENPWLDPSVTRRGVWPFRYNALWWDCPICLKPEYMAEVPDYRK